MPSVNDGPKGRPGAGKRAHYPVTPQTIQLQQIQKYLKAQAERREKLAKMRKASTERAEQMFLERFGVATDDPRLPIVQKALRDAGMKGMDIKDVKVSNEIATKAIAAYERAKRREELDVIYYVQVGELIKLGTTTNLARRMNGYPPDAAVLATEQGSYGLEGERIEQFSEYLAGRREWFHPGPRLVAHIESLRHAAEDDTADRRSA